MTPQQSARRPRQKLGDFRPGDQVRVHGCSPLTEATLTVQAINTAKGSQGMRVFAVNGSAAYVRPEQLHLLTPVHPWVTLAARLPDTVRLRAHPQGGRSLQARSTSPAGRWGTVGVIAAGDGEGEAAFSDAGSALLEAALMRLALASGWDVSRVVYRTGHVRVAVRFGSTPGVDHQARGSGNSGAEASGALALARALRLVCEECAGVSRWPLDFSEAASEEAWWQNHEADQLSEMEYFSREREDGEAT